MRRNCISGAQEAGQKPGQGCNVAGPDRGGDMFHQLSDLSQIGAALVGIFKYLSDLGVGDLDAQ